jgi:hypothetical protein
MLHRPPPPPDAKPPASALRRARNRRWRKRQREGRMTFVAEVDAVGIEWLVANGYLSEREASDARTLRIAVGRGVSMLIRISSQR